MGYFRKIVGERLYLSPFNADDMEIYTKWAEWLNDRAVSDNFGGHHSLVTPASAKKTLAELRGYRFAIILLDGDLLIGHISLHDVDHLNRNAFLGIFIGDEEHRGKSLKPHESFSHLKGIRFIFSDGIFINDIVQYYLYNV